MSKVGVVIPVGPGRIENLDMVLRSIADQYHQPDEVMVVFDGPESDPADGWEWATPIRVSTITTEYKHVPGREQPRNVGVRHLPQDVTDVWFLDSDVIVGPGALMELVRTRALVGPDAVICAPYDWLAEGHPRAPLAHLRNDPRWPSFDEYPDDYVSRGKLNDGLACFSGNLMWNRAEFERVGGYWNDLHHGRCEDGELGLRAVAEGVPIAFSKRARGWHLAHPINFQLARERNTRDVPMLNARHPWVEAGGLVVVDRDGKRFDQRCAQCGDLINTIEYWEHAAQCQG